MDELSRKQQPSGWSFFKVVGVIVGFMGMAGFGLCTFAGIMLAETDSKLWLWICFGAVLTLLSAWLVVHLFRKARNERDRIKP